MMSNVAQLGASRPLSAKAGALLESLAHGMPCPPLEESVKKRGHFGLVLRWTLEGKRFCDALPAADWVLFYLNQSALRLAGLDFASVLDRFPHANERRGLVVNVRLRDLDEAKSMCHLIDRVIRRRTAI